MWEGLALREFSVGGAGLGVGSYEGTQRWGWPGYTRMVMEGLLEGVQRWDLNNQTGLNIVRERGRGFPGGTGGKESACQRRRCKRCGLKPWVGNIPWSRKWRCAPIFLPEKVHGQRSLAGYSLQRGHEETQLNMHTEGRGAYCPLQRLQLVTLILALAVWWQGRSARRCRKGSSSLIVMVRTEGLRAGLCL